MLSLLKKLRTRGHDELALAGDLDATITDWLAYAARERGLADKTVEAYGRDLAQFRSFLSTKRNYPATLSDIANARPRDFRGFMAARRKAGTSSRSLARSMSALRMFYRFLDKRGLATNKAILSIALPKIPHSVPKPLTVDKAINVVEKVMHLIVNDVALVMLLT